jgi:hypothetical protein
MRFNLLARAAASLAICATCAAPLAAQMKANAPLKPMTPVTQKIRPKATTADLPVPGTHQPPAATAPTSTPTSTTSTMLKAGLYTFGMTATTVNGHAAGSNHTVSESVGISWNGATVSITGDNTSLQGQITNNHLSAVSNTSDGTLTLSGTPAANSANGTFTLAQGSNRASGNFTLGPMSQPKTMKKLNVYGAPKPSAPAPTCNWWCQFKAWF